MLKLNKAVFLLQSFFFVILVFTHVNLAPWVLNSWEQMPELLGKKCSCVLKLGHILPPHRHFNFVKQSRDYWCLCQHPQWHSGFPLPCNIPLLFWPCQVLSAGRITVCVPSTPGRNTTSHFMLLGFWSCAASTWYFPSLDLKDFVFKMHCESLRKLVVYASMSSLSSPQCLGPLNHKSPLRWLWHHAQDFCVTALSQSAGVF